MSNQKWKEWNRKKDYMNKKFSEFHTVNTDFIKGRGQQLRHLKLGTSKVMFYDKTTKQVVSKISIDKPFILQAIIIESDLYADTSLRNVELSRMVNEKMQYSFRYRDVGDEDINNTINNIKEYFSKIKTEDEIQEFEYLIQEYLDKALNDREFYTQYEMKFENKFGRQPLINHRVIDYFNWIGRWDWTHEVVVDRIFNDTIYWGNKSRGVGVKQIDLSLIYPDSNLLDDEEYELQLTKKLKEHNEEMKWFQYAVLPRVAIDYSVLAWVNLKTISPQQWVEIVAINPHVPLSLIQVGTLNDFDDTHVLDIAEYNASIIEETGRFYLYDIQQHGRQISVSDIYKCLPLEKQLDPNYYMNLENEEMIHDLIQNLPRVPVYNWKYNSEIDEDDEDEWDYYLSITRRTGSNAEFIYNRLSSEAKVKEMNDVIWNKPKLVSAAELNKAIESGVIENPNRVFVLHSEQFCNMIDEVPSLNLEKYLVEWAEHAKDYDSYHDGEIQSINLSLKNESHVQDFMIAAGCQFHKKGDLLKSYPQSFVLSPQFVIYKRCGKTYMQPRSTHEISESMSSYVEHESEMSICYENYRDEVFNKYGSEIVEKFIEEAKDRNLILTKGSIKKIKYCIPDFFIENYLFDKGIIGFKYRENLFQADIKNIAAFEKAKAYVRMSNKLVPKSDAPKTKKLKI